MFFSTYLNKQNQQKIKWNTLREMCPCWEFFWFVFSRIRTEYGVSLRIQSECRKIRTRITPNTDFFTQWYKHTKNNYSWLGVTDLMEFWSDLVYKKVQTSMQCSMNLLYINIIYNTWKFSNKKIYIFGT